MIRTTMAGAVLAAALPLAAADIGSAPVAKKVPHMQKLHGDELVDPYFWLRERDNPEVKAYLEKENAFAEAFMKPTEGFQKALYDEMLARIKETDLSVPYREHGWYYYSRTEKGKQYPIYCRRKGSARGARGDLSRRQRARQGRALHERVARGPSPTTGTSSPTRPTTRAFATTRCGSRT